MADKLPVDNSFWGDTSEKMLFYATVLKLGLILKANGEFPVDIGPMQPVELVSILFCYQSDFLFGSEKST